MAAFSNVRLPLATTAAVLAELFHMIADHPAALKQAWGLVRSDAFIVLSIADSDMPAIEQSMLKYSDRPMDFADATLLRLAERESLTTVFTIDHDDFETYRIKGRIRFRMVPAR